MNTPGRISRLITAYQSVVASGVPCTRSHGRGGSESSGESSPRSRNWAKVAT